jgi:hypothetical protein
VIGFSAYYASESIIAFFNLIKANPWIAPIALIAIATIVWFGMEKMTRRK